MPFLSPPCLVHSAFLVFNALSSPSSIDIFVSHLDCELLENKIQAPPAPPQCTCLGLSKGTWTEGTNEQRKNERLPLPPFFLWSLHSALL